MFLGSGLFALAVFGSFCRPDCGRMVRGAISNNRLIEIEMSAGRFKKIRIRASEQQRGPAAPCFVATVSILPKPASLAAGDDRACDERCGLVLATEAQAART